MHASKASTARSGIFLAIAAAVLTIGEPAGAQTPADTTITQSGTSTATDDGQGNYPPVHVKFSQELGGVPNVSATYGVAAHYGGKFHTHQVSLGATNVTRTGFDWQLPQSGNRSGTHLTSNLKWTATGAALQTGTVIPNYMVLTVIYAPPGTGGGHSTSSVTYLSGSTAGTLTSSSESFKSGVSVSIEASGGILGNGGGAGVSWDSSVDTTDGQSLEIKKSTTTTLSQTGPAADGINHDEDEIYLLLKPTISMALSTSVAE
ncbi:MAG TPA: hypothetical protein VGF71_14105, partial [Caulobacteraceae bacterium]